MCAPRRSAVSLVVTGERNLLCKSAHVVSRRLDNHDVLHVDPASSVHRVRDDWS